MVERPDQRERIRTAARIRDGCVEHDVAGIRHARDRAAGVADQRAVGQDRRVHLSAQRRQGGAMGARCRDLRVGEGNGTAIAIVRAPLQAQRDVRDRGAVAVVAFLVPVDAGGFVLHRRDRLRAANRRVVDDVDREAGGHHVAVAVAGRRGEAEAQHILIVRTRGLYRMVDRAVQDKVVRAVVDIRQRHREDRLVARRGRQPRAVRRQRVGQMLAVRRQVGKVDDGAAAPDRQEGVRFRCRDHGIRRTAAGGEHERAVAGNLQAGVAAIDDLVTVVRAPMDVEQGPDPVGDHAAVGQQVGQGANRFHAERACILVAPAQGFLFDIVGPCAAGRRHVVDHVDREARGHRDVTVRIRRREPERQRKRVFPVRTVPLGIVQRVVEAERIGAAAVVRQRHREHRVVRARIGDERLLAIRTGHSLVLDRIPVRGQFPGLKSIDRRGGELHRAVDRGARAVVVLVVRAPRDRKVALGAGRGLVDQQVEEAPIRIARAGRVLVAALKLLLLDVKFGNRRADRRNIVRNLDRERVGRRITVRVGGGIIECQRKRILIVTGGVIERLDQCEDIFAIVGARNRGIEDDVAGIRRGRGRIARIADQRAVGQDRGADFQAERRQRRAVSVGHGDIRILKRDRTTVRAAVVVGVGPPGDVQRTADGSRIAVAFIVAAVDGFIFDRSARPFAGGWAVIVDLHHNLCRTVRGIAVVIRRANTERVLNLIVGADFIKAGMRNRVLGKRVGPCPVHVDGQVTVGAMHDGAVAGDSDPVAVLVLNFDIGQRVGASIDPHRARCRKVAASRAARQRRFPNHAIIPGDPEHIQGRDGIHVGNLLVVAERANLQSRRSCKEIDGRVGLTDIGSGLAEIAAGALAAGGRCRQRAVGAGRDVDVACLERGDQGFLRDFHVVDHEGGDVEGRVLDDDPGAVRLDEDKVVAVDLDLLDGGAGGKLDDVVRGRDDLDARLGGGKRIGARLRSGLRKLLRMRFMKQCRRLVRERHRALTVIRNVGNGQVVAKALGSHCRTPSTIALAKSRNFEAFKRGVAQAIYCDI